MLGCADFRLHDLSERHLHIITVGMLSGGDCND